MGFYRVFHFGYAGCPCLWADWLAGGSIRKDFTGGCCGGDYKKAIIEFELACKMYPNPVILYNIAVCYDELRRYALAVKFCTRYVDEAIRISCERVKESFTV